MSPTWYNPPAKSISFCSRKKNNYSEVMKSRFVKCASELQDQNVSLWRMAFITHLGCHPTLTVNLVLLISRFVFM